MKKILVYPVIALALMMAAGCGNRNYNDASESEIGTQIPDDSIFEASPEAHVESELQAGAENPAGADSQTEASAETGLPAGAEKQADNQSETEIPEAADQANTEDSTEPGLLTSTVDIKLTDTDGRGRNYIFFYDGEEFAAKYTADNWKIVDSYKINNESDMTIICQALIDVKPVHGSDMKSYRNADDMVDEWVLHNMAYALLKEDDPLKSHAKDVDFDPGDQNKSFEEIYKDRTGKDFSIDDFLEYFTSDTETQDGGH